MTISHILNIHQEIDGPYIGLSPYKENDALFFFGREELCQDIMLLLRGHNPIVLYGESGVGKSSLLEAGVMSRFRRLTDDNREKLGIPKYFTVVINDWSNTSGNWLDNLMDKVKECVADVERVQSDDSTLIHDIKSITNEIIKEAKEHQYPQPSQFVLFLWACVKILRNKCKDDRCRLLIILDQFEGYFQIDQKKTDLSIKEFSEAVNAVNLPVSFIFAIQSDEFYRLEQRLKQHIPTILNNCLELKHFKNDKAKKAIVNPIERYNLIKYLENSPLTILSGTSNVGKSLLLRVGIIPYWSRFSKSAKDDEIYLHAHNYYYNNNWTGEPLAILEKAIEVFDAWQKHCVSLNNKFLILFDQFEDYLTKPQVSESGCFKSKLIDVLSNKSIRLLVSIRNISYLHNELKPFIYNMYDWPNIYLCLSIDKNITIHKYEDDQPCNFKFISLEDNNNFVDKVINSLGQMDEINGEIMTPYLQLVMEYIWEKWSLNNTNENNFFSFALTKIEEMGNDENDKLNSGIKNIVKECVVEKVEDFERIPCSKQLSANDAAQNNNIESNSDGTNKFINTQSVYRILSYLVTPSGSKNSLSVEDMVKYMQEEPHIIGLTLPVVNENYIRDVVNYLNKHRILRPTGVEQKKCYEIYFSGLSEAIRSCREVYLLQIRTLKDNESLPTKALADLRRGSIDKAAVSALTAYYFHNQIGYPTNIVLVYEALHEVLKSDYINCCFAQCDISEREFWKVALNPTKPMMMVASRHDGTLWLWDDIDNYPDKHKSIVAHNKDVKMSGSLDIALAFNKDGTILASTSRDKHIKLWDVEELIKLSDGKSIDPIYDISHDCLEYSVEENTKNRKKPAVPDDFISLIFTPTDEELLAVGDWKGNIWLFDVRKRKKPMVLSHLKARSLNKKEWDFSPGKNWVWSLAFSQNGKILAAGARDGFIHCWDISDPTNPKHLKNLPRYVKSMKDKDNRNREIYSIAFSPDGQWLASGSTNENISLWRFKAGDDLMKSPVSIKSLISHKKSVRAVTFSQEKPTDTTKYLVSASEDQTIRIWDLQKLGDKPKVLRGHRHCVNSVFCLPKNPLQIISCGWDRTIWSWIITETEPENKNKGDNNNNVVAVAFNEETSVIVHSDGTVKGLDKLTVLENDDCVVAVAFFSQDCKIVKLAWVNSGKEGIIRVCDYQGFSKPIEIRAKHQVSSLAFSPDGRYIVSGSRERNDSVKLWDLSQSNPPSISISFYKDKEVTSVAFHPKGNTQNEYIFAVANIGLENGEIKLWKWRGNDEEPISDDEVYKHPRYFGITPPFILTFSSQGNWLASGSDSRTIRIWEVCCDEPTQLKKKGDDLKVSNFWVSSLAFSQDEKWLASGFSDGSIELWDFNNLHNGDNQKNDKNDASFLLKKHDEQVCALSFRHDGKKLLSGDDDGKVYLWTIDITELVNKFGSELCAIAQQETNRMKSHLGIVR